MNRYLRILSCFFIILFVAGKSGAQSWCPPGAHWYSGYYSLAGPGYADYELGDDTIVAGKACKVIHCTRYGIVSWWYARDTIKENDRYTYASNDTVFFLSPEHNRWIATYFFNAQAGDTLLMPSVDHHTSFNDTALLKVVVDSASIMQIDTHHLRYYQFHALDTCFGSLIFSGRVVEKIGIIDNDLVPYWHCITDDYYYYLRCYEDSSFSLYSTGEVCDYLPTAIPFISDLSTAIRIYPNPANDIVTISIDESMIGSTATITDLTGRKLAAVELLTTANRQLSTAAFASGVYFVTVAGRDGRSATKKLVIQK